MSGASGAIRAYAELARVSNLPTCLSNVLVGFALGAGDGALGQLRPAVLLEVALGIALLYAGGMALNDVADLYVDRRERPGRPLPSGRISGGAARTFVVVCFVAGLFMITMGGRDALGPGVALLAAIVGYDLLHKRHPAAALLMGACRGLVYLVAARAVGGLLDVRVTVWLAGALALYVVTITVVARAETSHRLGVSRWLAVTPPLIVLAPMVALPPRSWVAGAAAALLLVWLGLGARLALRRPPRTVQAILTWIAGICLVDAFFLTLLGRPAAAFLACACFGLTVWGHRRVLGT